MRLLQKAPLLLALLSFPALGHSQEMHSGFITIQSASEENSALKIQADNLTLANSKDIAADFGLYRDIVSYEFDLEHHKIFVKFHSPMDANMVLGILERRAIHAYYLGANNSPVSYYKSGQEVFRR